MRYLLLLLLSLSMLAPALAQTTNTRRLPEGSAPPPARVEELAWLTGNWLGTGFGDLSEETWQPPKGGSMLGLFRQHKDGKPMFYEFLLLLETEGTVELRLKHFNPDGTGWEEKDKYLTFRLVALEPNAAYFSGLTYRLQGENLEIFLALKNNDGALKEHSFLLKRTP